MTMISIFYRYKSYVHTVYSEYVVCRMFQSSVYNEVEDDIYAYVIVE